MKNIIDQTIAKSSLPDVITAVDVSIAKHDEVDVIDMDTLLVGD
jgi:hypothetical protein